MKRSTSRLLPALAGIGLGLALVLTGVPAVASDSSAAPQNLQVVIGDDGLVERLAWDPPGDGTTPGVYHVNYRFASDGPEGEQVFWSTPDTYLESTGTFGRFVGCAPDRPIRGWVVWITYPTPDGVSPRSNEVNMCLP